MSKKNKGNKKHIIDDDDDDETTTPARNVASLLKPGNTQPTKVENKKKGKKGGKNRGDDSDDEEAPAAALLPVAKNTKKGKKGGKGRGNDSDEEEAPAMLPVAKNNKKGKKAGKGRVEDSDEEELVAAMLPVAKNSKKKGKGKAQAAAVSDSESEEDDSDDEDDEPVAMLPVASKNKGKAKGKAKGGKQGALTIESEEDDSEEEEESAAMLPVASKNKGKAKGKDKSGKRDGDSDEVEPVGMLPVAKNNKKGKKAGKGRVEDSDEEELVAAMLPVAKNNKKKGKGKAQAAAVSDSESEEDDSDSDGPDEEAEEEDEEEDEPVAAASVKTRKPSKKAAAAAAAAAAGSDDDDDDDDDDVEEITAAMKATMFGDEVAHDWAPSSSSSSSSSVADGSKKGEKMLSNKARRRLQKEEEAKAREDEYNKASLIASAEGRQFACSQSIVDPNDPVYQNSLDVIIPDFSISAHKKELFVNAQLTIVHGHRYGLVAPNGAGKSTLLKMIAAKELTLPPRVDFLYVEQEVVADETPAFDAVLKADKERWALLQEEKAILAALKQFENAPRDKKKGDKKTDGKDAKGNKNKPPAKPAVTGSAFNKTIDISSLDTADKLDERLGEVYEQMSIIDAAGAEPKARRILFGLGFDMEMQQRQTKYFSGGWRMRISLARALFMEPTLLMLDEPTNHLDLNAVIWLDDYLQKWRKTLLIVSHDQDFLNSVCNEIVHVEQKKLCYYKGNYDTFKEQEEIKRKQTQKEWEKQEKKIRELKSKGMTKENAEKAQVKSKSREPGARSKKAEAAAMAMGGVESGESKVELIKRPKEYVVRFHFPTVLKLNPPILEVRDVHFRYSESLPWLFKNVNFGIDMESRICIVGPNGSGKSTMLKLITDAVKPTEGEVLRNPRLTLGIYNQHFVDRLPMEEDPVSYIRRLFSDVSYQEVRNQLGRYGLEGHAHTIPIRDLSGGQKARVVFVELSLQSPHLLFLDEPTNNLDIESIDALCDALKVYNGGVVLVSHDARLIESTNCQLWVVDDQNVTPWVEGFNDYRGYLLAKLEEQVAAIMPGSGERPGEVKPNAITATPSAAKAAPLLPGPAAAPAPAPADSAAEKSSKKAAKAAAAAAAAEETPAPKTGGFNLSALKKGLKKK